MKAVMGLFMHRLVIQGVGLAAFCSLIWIVGPLLSIAHRTPLESPTSRLLLILALVVLWGGYHLFLQARARKKNRQLVNDLAAPAAGDDQASIEEARTEEAAHLRQKFQEALQLLKTSGSGAGRGGGSLYDLPWYVIIGGPGTGKTTLLLNSGLKFPLSERLGKGPLKGVGGTRDCDWFFTNEAVFLDTAGRYTTQDSHRQVDKAAWDHFLGLLKKHRPRRPINGVLLAVSVSELMEQSEEERQGRARELRKRIVELYGVLGNRFPIYLAFTKCDLVAGFTDFFADMDQEDRVQVWGETFQGDASTPIESRLARFEKDFDEVVLRRMHQRMLERIQEERDVERRGLIMSFPRQMALLKPTLMGFLNEVFGASRYEAEPFLRGVYFTSATQEGTPIDRIMGALAGAYGMDRQGAPVFSGKGKSFFITRLLEGVIFPEAEIAGVDRRMEDRRRRLRWAAYGILAVMTAGMLALWAVSYVGNRQAIAQVEDKVARYRSIPVDTDDGEAVMKAIAARLDALTEARNVYADRTRLLGLGLYQGDKVRSGIDDVYEQRLKVDLLPEMGRRLKGTMIQILQEDHADDSGFLYELLRAYLMLGYPERMDTRVAGATIRKLWEHSFPREPRLRDRLGVHSDRLLELYLDPVSLDAAFVESVRRRLKAVPVGTQIYAYLKSTASVHHALDFRLSDVIPPPAAKIFTTSDGRELESLTIPGLYTRQGYTTFFQERGLELIRQALRENWVLNQNADDSAGLDRLYDDLQKQYFAEYEMLWHRLLSNLELKKARGIYETIETLDILTGHDTPLQPLLEAVAQNTSLTGIGDEAAEGAPEPDTGEGSSPLARQGRRVAVSPEPARKLEARFQPLHRLVQSRGQAPPPLDGVIKTLDEVRDVMLRLTSGATGEEQALKYARERLDWFGAGDVIQKANVEFARLPEPVGKWLGELVSTGWGVVLDQAKAGMNDIWKAQVAAPYTAGLHNRYPLFRNSRREATMADFSAFFAPGGHMDRFFERYLKAYVVMSGSEWKQAEGDQQPVRVSRQVLDQFQYAARIREAFFPAGGTVPHVRFHLKPVALDAGVAGFRINIEGQGAEYAHGPALTASFQWPGPSPGLGVVLTFVTFDGRMITQVEEGPWAWLRTVDKAMADRRGQRDVFRLTFQVEGYKARYELRADSVHNPFNLVELEKFRCPAL